MAGMIGGVAGLVWFAAFGSDAEWFGGFSAALAGTIIGSIVGGSWGWSFATWRSASVPWQVGAVLGWTTCGTSLVVGIVYIGGWTDADGPTAEAIVGILGIPTSMLGVWAISRLMRVNSSSRREIAGE